MGVVEGCYTNVMVVIGPHKFTEVNIKLKTSIPALQNHHASIFSIKINVNNVWKINSVTVVVLHEISFS